MQYRYYWVGGSNLYSPFAFIVRIIMHLLAYNPPVVNPFHSIDLSLIGNHKRRLKQWSHLVNQAPTTLDSFSPFPLPLPPRDYHPSTIIAWSPICYLPSRLQVVEPYRHTYPTIMSTWRYRISSTQMTYLLQWSYHRHYLHRGNRCPSLLTIPVPVMCGKVYKWLPSSLPSPSEFHLRLQSTTY